MSVFTVEEDHHVMHSIKQLHAELLSFFIRTHRSYLINPLHIDEYCRLTSLIKLSKEHTVPVSRRRKRVVEKELKFFYEKIR